jgi:hypothetical protein
MMVLKRRPGAGSCALSVALAAILLGSCIHHARPAIVAYTEQERLFVRGDCPQGSETCLPFKGIEADRYASQKYDHYLESGFVTLRPDMRLQIVANRDRPGDETAVYNLVAAGNGGAVSVEPDGTPDRKHFLEGVPDNVWLRLYFQSWHSRKDHTTVLLFAKAEAHLNEASGAFEEDPDGFCAAPHNDAHCVVFPQSTAVTAEVKVRVRKRDIYVPISATVRDALTAYGDVDLQHVAPDLKLERLWAASLVPLRIETKPAAILSLPVVAGDRITW